MNRIPGVPGGAVLGISVGVAIGATIWILLGLAAKALADEPPVEAVAAELDPKLAKARRYNRKLERVVHRLATRAERHERTVRRQRLVLRNRYRPAVTRIISLSATAYEQSATTLIRKARCETGGTFSPYAFNEGSGASGLFQFLPSTFRSTPFAGYSIWDPFASSLAAAWMHDRGRGGEWECR